jgi:Sensors of blue-light using FAD
MLRRLAWSSVPSSSFSAAHLNQIIAPSRRNNERNHISGMLLFTGAHFLAMLEGEERELGALWLRLEQDQRHCDLFRIGDDLCGKRMYSEWMMAYIVDSKVDEQIEALRSLQARVDVDHARAGARAETVRSLHARSMPMWAQIIQPIMARADSM